MSGPDISSHTASDNATGGVCHLHGDQDAITTCHRCGVFVCEGCRRFYDYQPLCEGCYERRGHGAPASSRSRWAMILGVVGLTLVVIPLGVPAVALAHAELSAIERGAAPAGGLGYARAGAIFGWVANLFFVLLALVAGAMFWLYLAEPYAFE